MSKYGLSHKPLRLFTQGSCKSDTCWPQWLNIALTLSMECSKFKVPCLAPGVRIGPSQRPAYRVCVQWWPGKSDIFVSQKAAKRDQQSTWLRRISTPAHFDLSPFRPQPFRPQPIRPQPISTQPIRPQPVSTTTPFGPSPFRNLGMVLL